MAAIKSIPDYYVTEYETNWSHKAQQKISLLKDQVILDNIDGKEKSYNKIGTVEFQRVTERAGATRVSDLSLEKRWLRPFPFDDTKVFDEWDEKFLGEISLPSSQLMEAQAAAYARLADSIILQAAVGDAYTGENGTSVVSLPSTQTVAVNYVESGTAANSGLTIGKLRRAKYILDDNDVDDMEPRTVAYCAKQLQDLLRSVEIGSKDYNAVQALVDGQVNKFLGFTFKRVSSKVLPISGGVRQVVFWAKNGLRLSDSGKQTRMDILPTQSHALQVRSVGVLGATRDEEARVGIIYCDETV